MPWHIERQNKKYCVIKNADGEVEGCHSSQAAARRQMAALYASEGKEMGNSITININEVEAEVEDKQEEESTLKDRVIAAINDVFKAAPTKTVNGKKHPASDFLVVEDPQSPTTWHLPVKSNGTPDRGLASAAWAALFSAGGHRGNQYEGPNKADAQRKLRALYRSQEWEIPDSNKEGFMLWKEGDTYRWLARYSNNLRDQDSPPEIISAQSHKAFVEMVDRGEAPMPELWLWHRPEWKWGKATWLAYDDSGFAMAAGVVDKGKEWLAEAISEVSPDGVRVSHGMPVKSIKRDPEDETIIIQHITHEISPLTAWAAANNLTGFQILGGNNMALPKDKRQSLVEEWGLPDELLDRLEQANAEEADKAAQDGVESKEKEAETEEVEVKDEPTPDEQPAEEAAEAPPAAEPVTRDELVEAMGALGQAFRVLTEQVGALAGEVKTLKKARTVEEAESLTDIFQRAIGHPSTRVDGRTQEAKARPHETKPQGEQVVNSGNLLADSIVNEIVTGSWLDAFRQTQQ